MFYIYLFSKKLLLLDKLTLLTKMVDYINVNIPYFIIINYVYVFIFYFYGSRNKKIFVFLISKTYFHKQPFLLRTIYYYYFIQVIVVYHLFNIYSLNTTHIFETGCGIYPIIYDK